MGHPLYFHICAAICQEVLLKEKADSTREQKKVRTILATFGFPHVIRDFDAAKNILLTPHLLQHIFRFLRLDERRAGFPTRLCFSLADRNVRPPVFSRSAWRLLCTLFRVQLLQQFASLFYEPVFLETTVLDAHGAT